MNPLHKKILLAAVGILLLVGVVVGFLLWNTSPRRTMNAFLEAVEAKDGEQVMSYVSQDIKAATREEIQWFVDDWVTGEKVETELTKDESWRSRDKMVKNEQGELVAKTDKKGNVKKEVIPTPNYWAHHYQADVTVTFDDYEDPVIIKLRRETDDSWSIFKQPFRGWVVTAIKYQPIDESDFEDILESGDEFQDFQDIEEEELSEEETTEEITAEEGEGETVEEEVTDEDSAAGTVEEGTADEETTDEDAAQ